METESLKQEIRELRREIENLKNNFLMVDYGSLFIISIAISSVVIACAVLIK
jgi:tmRNA-binding protein